MDAIRPWLQNVTQPPLLYALLGVAALLICGVTLLLRGGRRKAPPKISAQEAPPADTPAQPLLPDGTAVTAHIAGQCGEQAIDERLSITGEALLGREPDCALCLASPRVSRRHVRLVARGGELWAENLSHSTLTCVEGELLLTPRALHSGDELLLGETRLTITIGEEHA